MPPRHKTASTASKTVVTDTVDIDIDRQFSGRPLDRELWYQSNKEQLMFECPGAKAFIESGLVISIMAGAVAGTFGIQPLDGAFGVPYQAAEPRDERPGFQV